MKCSTHQAVGLETTRPHGSICCGRTPSPKMPRKPVARSIRTWASARESSPPAQLPRRGQPGAASGDCNRGRLGRASRTGSRGTSGRHQPAKLTSHGLLLHDVGCREGRSHRRPAPGPGADVNSCPLEPSTSIVPRALSTVPSLDQVRTTGAYLALQAGGRSVSR